MIVRLKASYSEIEGVLRIFQFYDSPIKSNVLFTDFPFEKEDFNSMIVRLKVEKLWK